MKQGDAAYGDFGRYGNIDVREGTVVRVTPSGQVVVDFGSTWAGNGQARTYRFKNGWEVGGEQGHSGRLIAKSDFDALKAKQAARDAILAIHSTADAMRKVSHKEGLLAALADLTVKIEALP